MSRRGRVWGIWLLALTAVLVAVSLLSFCTGSVAISLRKIPSTLVSGTQSPEWSILIQLRLPRVLLGLAVGGGLSVAGVILQNLFRNPLVEPYTLGLSGGAALGVCLTIVLGLHRIWSALTLPLAAFIGAIAVMVTVYTVSMRAGFMKTNTLLLAGVMISFVCSSFIMLLMAISRVEDLHGIMFWVMGSLQQTNWALVLAALTFSVVGTAVVYLFCISLNALALGEEEAMHLGVDVEKIKRFLFLAASLLTSISVAVAGIIGFVGLTVPHLIRLVLGADHRILLPASYLTGATFLILCDTLARTLASPLELPVGAITGVLGGSLFIYVLTRR